MQRAINYTIYFLIAAAIILRGPTILNNLKNEGKIIEPQKIYSVSNTGETLPVVFPAVGKKSVAIFWASWCAPCKIELSRINSLIESKEVSKDRIFAISIDENKNEMLKAYIDRKYLFNTYLDTERALSNVLKIESTPTIVLINEQGKIEWQATGFSPTLINRIKKFLN